MTKKKTPLGLRNKRVSTMFRLLFSKAVTVGVPKNVSETEFFSYMNEKCNLQRSGFKKWTARPKKERLSVFQKMRLSGVAGILLFSSVALMVLLAAYSAYFVTFMQDSPEFVFWGNFGGILVGILIAMFQDFIFGAKMPVVTARSQVDGLLRGGDAGAMRIGIYYYICLSEKSRVSFSLGDGGETDIFTEYRAINKKESGKKRETVLLRRLNFKDWELRQSDATARRFWGNAQIRSFILKEISISVLMTALICLESGMLCYLTKTLYHIIPAAVVTALLIFEMCVAFAKHK